MKAHLDNAQAGIARVMQATVCRCCIIRSSSQDDVVHVQGTPTEIHQASQS